MSEYTLHSLSDADFEDLVCDLLDRDRNLDLRPFAKGRDLGIDLLHGGRISEGTVVQCKHYCRSKLSDLKSSLKHTELPKLNNLKPQKYIVATSLSLTPPNKMEISEILGTFCSGIDDIYGLEDIQKLIRNNPDIEVAHHKLWLTSTAVLKRVLHNGMAVWNELTKEAIQRKMSLYVQTGAYEEAMKLLSKHHSCILSGIPGIGKTTLAQILTTRLMDDGFELISARHDIDEALSAIDNTKKQVVFYDDFLGQSSVSEKLSKNEDRGILQLLEQARKSENLRVILTTREYILVEAKQIYEPLANSELDLSKCIVKIEDYTDSHKARILYNHLYFSNLSDEHIQSIVHDNNFLKIIQHVNYFPRAIEWMTLGIGSLEIPADSYAKAFLQTLDHPERIWQPAFDNQITDDSRYILFCLGSITGLFGLEELKLAWSKIRGNKSGEVLSIADTRLFTNALKHLEGSFTKSVKSPKSRKIAVGFHNPSIMDFVRIRIAEDENIRHSIINSAVCFDQISCLLRLKKNGNINRMPTDLVEINEQLITMIRGTIHNDSVSYQLESYGQDTSPELSRFGSWICNRLSDLASWSKASGNAIYLTTSYDIANNLIQSGELGNLLDFDICPLLEAIAESDTLNDDKKSLMQFCIDELVNKLDWRASPDDWSTWIMFVDDCSWFSITDRMDWADRADEYCEYHADDLISESTGSIHARQILDEMKEISSRLGGSWHNDVSDIEERIDEIEAGEDEWAEMQRDDYRSTTRDVSPSGDDDFTHLFQSFEGRDDSGK